MRFSKYITALAIVLNVGIGFSAEDLTQFVDLKIGTGDSRGSNCVIGPQMPFGSINPSPQTPNGTTSGYNPKFPVRGFGQLHVSGTGGSGKYGHFLVSPQLGFEFRNNKHDSPASQVEAKPFKFSCFLDRYKIQTEIAPTHHAAIYRFTFPQTDSATIVLDATQNIPLDILKKNGKVLENKLSIDKQTGTVRAMISFQGGWAGVAPYTLYFVAQFKKKALQSGVWRDSTLLTTENSVSRSAKQTERIGAVCRFATKVQEPVLMKVAISFASYENAEKYLQTEIPDWNFEKTVENGRSVWEKQLAKIHIETESVEQKKIFYTAMYHSMIMPRDRSGDNGKWQSGEPFWDDHYAVWDTWRTLFPLQLLINPDMVRGNIRSFIDRLKNNGQVRDAFIGGVDGYSDQGGNDVDNIVADAYTKKLSGINWDEAYKLLKFNADNERLGYTGTGKIKKPAFGDAYRSRCWIQDTTSSSSYTLEYAYNDFSIAQLAKGLGKSADYQFYLKRSRSWENLWDTTKVDKGYRGFAGIRSVEGKFKEFDVRKNAGSWKNAYYEASSWTYTYFVPHDFEGLITKMGGKAIFTERLEFALNNRLIDYGNEPSFLTLRAFNHAGRPDLTSRWVHKLMRSGFSLAGVPGNDDSGAMSSWYIFSAMGFFPNAGQDFYYLNAPLYKKTELRLENGKVLTIVANNLSDKNIYIKSCKFNGNMWSSSIIRHNQIANGGTLEFELTDVPGDWGK